MGEGFRNGYGRGPSPYHIVRPAVKKLPARTMHLAMPLALTFVMTFIVSGIATVRAMGLEPGMTARWMESWMASWMVAFPTMLFLMPLMRRLLSSVIETR